MPEVNGDWLIAASKLYAAIKSLKLVHAAGCDAENCETCKQGYEACCYYAELCERDVEEMMSLGGQRGTKTE